MRKGLLIRILLSCGLSLCGVMYAENNLFISVDDIRLEAEESDSLDVPQGYHLYVRQKSGVNSILLTETTKDPDGKIPNYAYRALEYNVFNGDEIRLLDGKKLDSENSKYSLIDSTPEDDEEFGKAFHIYIPATVQFGYPWTRNGIVSIGRGTFVNIRAFEKKYGDYSGSFFDNSFMFDMRQKKATTKPMKTVEKDITPEIPHGYVIAEEIVEKKENVVPVEETPAEEELPADPEAPASEEASATEEVPAVGEVLPVEKTEKKSGVVLTDAYSPTATEEFSKFAEFVTFSKGPETIVQDIMESLNSIESKDNVDIVFAIDATGSMKDDIEQLRNEWIPELIKGVKQFGYIRLGLLLYRDYGDNFKYNGLPVRFFNFTDDVDVFARYLNAFEIKGKEGGDIPEAVYEALYGSMAFYRWNSEASKKIILIGDAEPHPTPRGSGRYSKDLVLKMAEENNISIEAIITPDDKTARGR